MIKIIKESNETNTSYTKEEFEAMMLDLEKAIGMFNAFASNMAYEGDTLLSIMDDGADFQNEFPSLANLKVSDMRKYVSWLRQHGWKVVKLPQGAGYGDDTDIDYYATKAKNWEKDLYTYLQFMADFTELPDDVWDALGFENPYKEDVDIE